jgi:flagellar hook protein FlgE
MLNSLNAGVSGLQQFQSQIDLIGNNIANVNTTGFKSSRMDFADTFVKALNGSSPGDASSVYGNGVRADGITTSFAGGGLTSTEKNTDLAIDNGEGFFSVVNPENGENFVTRSGNFKVDGNGFLVTNQGYRVQGTQSDGQIVGDLKFVDDVALRGDFDPEGASYIGSEVLKDGKIMVMFDNGTSYQGGQIRLQNFVAPQELTKVGNNLYSNLDSALPINANGEIPGTGSIGQIQSRALETSNVDLTGEFTNLIVAQRAFQANARMVTTSDQMMQEIVQLKR